MMNKIPLLCAFLITLVMDNQSFATDRIPTEFQPTGQGIVYSYCSKSCNPRIDELCIPCPLTAHQEKVQNNLYGMMERFKGNELDGFFGSGTKMDDCSPRSDASGRRYATEIVEAIAWMDRYSSYNVATRMQSGSSGHESERDEFFRKFEERHPKPFGVPQNTYERKKKDIYHQYRYIKTVTDKSITIDEALERL